MLATVSALFILETLAGGPSLDSCDIGRFRDHLNAICHSCPEGKFYGENETLSTERGQCYECPMGKYQSNKVRGSSVQPTAPCHELTRTVLDCSENCPA
jgi:hypothetical protein